MSDDNRNPVNSARTTGPTSERRTLVTRTYLSLHELAQFRPGSAPRRVASLRSLAGIGTAPWRALYARVGAPWHWHDRDQWSDEALARYLARAEVTSYAIDAPPVSDAGLLELCTHDDGSVEIVYLGLVTDVHGHGLGAWLLGEAVRLAWARGATRVWLHTCTLDGPSALPNYLARGFTVDRTETYEVAH